MVQFSPLRLVVVAVVISTSLLDTPSPGFHGKSLAISVALLVFLAGVFFEPHRWLRGDATVAQVIDLLFVGAAGVALASLQPQSASELPASAAVFLAALRLSPWPAGVVGVPVTIGLGITISTNTGGQAIAASVLLCVVLGVAGGLVRQARLNQGRTEQLLAELEDARDEQARAAAVAERTRIARDLHDVLAHSLSGLSIQLEGARKLAQNDGASSALSAVIDRASLLAKQGLDEARSAVGVLRDDDLRRIERLPELVEQYRRDFGLVVSVAVEGTPRTVPPEVSLTLYRAAGEALTNVSRYAPGAHTDVLVQWSSAEVHLRVADKGGAPGMRAEDSGGGWGLVGMLERVSRLGGRCEVGPRGSEWVVDVVVPA